MSGSISEMRAVLQEELRPVRESVKAIETRLFVGSDNRRSLQEEVAISRERLESVSEDVERLKKKKSSPPSSRLPEGFWKAVGIITLTIATAIGGMVGVNSQSKTSNNAQP